MGIAPIIGFNYGNRNDVQQKRVFSISMRFIAAASILIFAVSMFGGSILYGCLQMIHQKFIKLQRMALLFFHTAFYSAA